STSGACMKAPSGSTDEDKIKSIVQEKGLTLVSDLPVYIKGELNPHNQEEFKNTLDDDWGNFYTRKDLNPNFACRQDDPRLKNCKDGDEWRPATVLADSITLLSDDNGKMKEGFRFGFRDEGDFDLRNNAGSNNVIIGYDLDGSATIDTNKNIPERTFSDLDTNNKIEGKNGEYGIDLNGDGEITEPSNKNPAIEESEITVQAARILNGFDPYNNFVTNGLSSGAFKTDGSLYDGTGTQVKDEDYRTATSNIINSSYFNNFVTPIQRRGEFPEYVMEICYKPFVAACGPEDWVVGYDLDNDKTRKEDGTEEIASWDLPKELDGKSIDPFTSGGGFDPTKLLAGTTDLPPLDPNDRRFPRRVAFVRDDTGKLVLDGGQPIPWGIKSSDDELGCYTISNNKTIALPGNGTPINVSCPSGNQPRLRENALWFMTVKNTADYNFGSNYPLWPYNLDASKTPAIYGADVKQPLLVPAVQLGATTTTPNGERTVADVYSDPTKIGKKNDLADEGTTSWIMPAANGNDGTTTTTYNLILGTGDIPSRMYDATNAENNGGLPNLPRLLENWRGKTVKILGSFIQFKRSEYATAPFQPILRQNNNDDKTGPFPSNLFKVGGSPRRYETSSTAGVTPYFSQPNRSWGFDVGLLSQPPDLFAQKFSTGDTQFKPDEFLREVSRNDEWVKTLLCAKEAERGGNAVGDNVRQSIGGCN
ncbi:MAG: hormogonium polysaccharide biosynthesis protein HpsA, partial [Limnoraphis sp.]